MSLANIKIETGDLVCLNSGSPALTVSQLRLTPEGRTLVTVDWLNDDATPQQREWDAIMLKPAAQTVPQPAEPGPTTPSPAPPAPKPSQPPKYVALKSFGVLYSANTRDGHGWITRLTEAHPYHCFFCDGRRKESADRGSLKDALAWMEQFY